MDDEDELQELLKAEPEHPPFKFEKLVPEIEFIDFTFTDHPVWEEKAREWLEVESRESRFPKQDWY